MEEELGWLYVHGASAGGASIVAWEGLRHAIDGGLLLAVYSIVTFLGLHLVMRHHRNKIMALSAQKAAEANYKSRAARGRKGTGKCYAQRRR